MKNKKQKTNMILIYKVINKDLKIIEYKMNNKNNCWILKHKNLSRLKVIIMNYKIN